MANISSQLVSAVGFSNGWAELALKKPPPLLPSSLIHSWEAIGPEGDGLLARPGASSRSAVGSHVWGTPCQTRTSAPTIEIGSRM